MVSSFSFSPSNHLDIISSILLLLKSPHCWETLSWIWVSDIAYKYLFILLIYYFVKDVIVIYNIIRFFVCLSGHWDSMEEYTCMIPRDTHDGAFYRAVLALHQDLFSLAQQVLHNEQLMRVIKWAGFKLPLTKFFII